MSGSFPMLRDLLLHLLQLGTIAGCGRGEAPLRLVDVGPFGRDLGLLAFHGRLERRDLLAELVDAGGLGADVLLAAADAILDRLGGLRLDVALRLVDSLEALFAVLEDGGGA